MLQIKQISDLFLYCTDFTLNTIVLKANVRYDEITYTPMQHELNFVI